MKKTLFLAAVLGLLIPMGCETTQLADTARGVLEATGNADEKNLALVDAGRRALDATLPMNYEDERTLGGSIAISSVEKHGNILDNPALQRYVTLVGLSVARRTNRPDVPFRFAVVDSPEINAWAAPGGYIFITRGAIELMEDEAQLAGVLGHEITHVTRYHMVTMLKRAQFFSAAAEGASVFGEDSTRIASGVNGGLDVIFENGYDKKMEYEADTVGIEYAATAGYDASGLTRYLRLLQRVGVGTGGGWMTSTHPELADRVERLNIAYEAGDFASLGGAQQKDRFARETASLRK